MGNRGRHVPGRQAERSELCEGGRVARAGRENLLETRSCRCDFAILELQTAEVDEGVRIVGVNRQRLLEGHPRRFGLTGAQ